MQSMSASATSTPAGRKAGLGVLLVTCISALIVNANTSAVSILLPAISEDTGTSTTTLQWAVTGYSLVGAAVIVTAGALGDIAGRRKIFTGALVLFIVSCVLIALTDSGAGVIVGRAIQGAAGSTLLACGLSLLSVAASGPNQLKAVSLWGAASAVGAAAGPLIGGVLVDSTGWQGLFWITAAVAAVCIPVTLSAVEESSDPNRPRSLDLLGMVLIAGLLVPFVLALSLGSGWGWGSPQTLGCFALSAACGFGFVSVEQRATAPLVDLKLLKNAVLVGSTLAILIGAGTINGLMYVVSLFFQDPAGLGMTPLEAGLATLPATLGLILVTPFVAKLATKIGSRPTIAVGFLVTTVGFAVFIFATSDWRYGTFVLPLIAIAVGMGLSNNTASSAATSSVDQAQVGEASGISNMARYVGAALLTAAVATIYGAAADDAGSGAERSDAIVDGLSQASILMTVVSGLGIALALLYGRHRPRQAELVDLTSAASGSIAHTVPTPARTPVATPAATPVGQR